VLIEALTELAASMIRRGADPAAVEAFVDDQIARIEAKPGDLRK
jgi:hypothetical protein